MYTSKLIILILFIPLISSQEVDIQVSGLFGACYDQNNVSVLCLYKQNATFIEWGTPIIGSLRSGLEFNTSGKITLSLNGIYKTSIGTLIHHNWPIKSTSDYPIPKYIDFNLTLNIEDVIIENITIPYYLYLDETDNKAYPLGLNDTCPYENATEWYGLYNSSHPCCPYYTTVSSGPCSDKIAFIYSFSRNHTFIINETQYTLKIEGFIDSSITESLVETFITQEKKITTAFILASLIAKCSVNATCDDYNECTFDECIDDFCFHNITYFDHYPCNYSGVLNSSENGCFEDICWQGECERSFYNCSNSSSSSTSTNGDGSSSGNDSGDGGSSSSSHYGDGNNDLLPLWVSLASLLCLLALLSPLLLLPLLCLLLPLVLLKDVSLPSAAGVKNLDPAEMGQVSGNPIYEEMEDILTNPIYEL